MSAPDEPTTIFPPTYMVLVCSRTISNEAFMWLLDKVRGKRRDGGAELLGVTLHVSASKIKFLEVAEELELKKRDREGLVREFAVSQLEEFLAEGMHVDDLLTTAERQHIVRHELENIRALAEDDHVPGHDGLGLYEGQRAFTGSCWSRCSPCTTRRRWITSAASGTGLCSEDSPLLYFVSLPIVLLCMTGAFFVMLASFWAEEYLVQVRRTTGLRAGAVLVLTPSIVYTALVFVMNLYYRRLATRLTEKSPHTNAGYALVEGEGRRAECASEGLAQDHSDDKKLREEAGRLKRRARAQVAKYLSYLTFEQLLGFEGGVAGVEAAAPLLKRQEPERRSPEQEEALDALLAGVPALDADDPRIEPALREGDMERYEGTYDDYLEMFVQFGYVFLFSSVYPMAAFWAVVNNVLEIRCDAFKLCRVFQRPMAKRVKDTGAWQRAFEALGAMSVMTNCGLLAISPELRHLKPDVGAVDAC
ncbi:Anoctamin [Gryllus bimaculatus]|nr:Anoctamin [Gryllus bimaculatus]